MNDISDDKAVQTLLPRSAWTSKMAYLKAIFKAKKALENIEKEAGI